MFNARLSSIGFLLLLLLVGLILSFYKLENFYHLGYDQERDYREVQRMVSQRRPVLIGPRVVSESGFHLGPWHYYILLPFYLISNGDPVFQGYVAGLVNVLATVLIFKFVAERTSLFSGFLTGMIFVSELHRTPWNVMYYPLISVAIAWIILYEKYNLKSVLSLAFLLGLGINFHIQFIFLLPAFLIFLLRYLKGQTTNRKVLDLAKVMVTGIIPFIPLIIFDFLHRFLNFSSAMTFFLRSTEVGSNYFEQLRFSFIQFVKASQLIFPVEEIYRSWILVILLILLFYFNRSKPRILSLLLVVVSSILTLSFYGGLRWPEYYHAAAVLIFLLISFITFGKTRIGLVVALVLVIINFSKTVATLQKYDDQLGYNHQREVMLYVLKKTKPYNRPNITYDFPLGEGTGFGILRDYYEVKVGPHNPSTFFLSYSGNPRQNETKKTFGLYAVSENWKQ